MNVGLARSAPAHLLKVAYCTCSVNISRRKKKAISSDVVVCAVVLLLPLVNHMSSARVGSSLYNAVYPAKRLECFVSKPASKCADRIVTGSVGGRWEDVFRVAAQAALEELGC